MRSWTLFFAEMGLFLASMCCVNYLYLEPHLQKNFVTVLQQKTGLKASVGPLFFSPLGKIHGRELYLNGFWEGRDIVIRVKEYKVAPRENILLELWQQGEAFDVKNLHYDMWFKEVSIENKSDQRSFILADCELGWEEGRLKIFLGKASFRQADQLEVRCAEFDARYQNTTINATAKDLVVTQMMNKFECAVLQVQGRINKESYKAQELKVFDLVMHSLEDVKIIGVQGQYGEKKLSSTSGRIQRVGSESWSFSMQGIYEQWPLVLNFQIDKLSEDLWSATGQQYLDAFQKKLYYKLSGDLNAKGPWSLMVYDEADNKISLDVTRDSAHEWMGTWTADMKNIPMLNDNWPAVSGRFDGGLTWDESELRMVLKGKNVHGGPGKTKDGYVDGLLSIFPKNNTISIEHFLLGEEGKWKGFLKGSADYKKLKLETLQLKVDKFPLGQYSPKVSGDLDIRAQLEANFLDVRVSAEALYPDKDPLQKLEKLDVSVQVDDHEIRYRQTFTQNGDENIIKVYANVDHVLTDPMKIRDGVLTKLESSSQLFELRLQESVPVRINAEGIEVKKFFIDDLNLRLRELKGHAYIPFIMPSRLLIEAKGVLDLGKMPQIGESRVVGQVKLYRAKWDKGWSLCNIDVSWAGDKIQLIPQGVFENCEVHLQGTMENSRITIEHAEGVTPLGGKILASGNYNMAIRNLDLHLSAEKLNFNHKDYRFSYNCPSFDITGDPLALAMSGNINIDRFFYSGDFSMMGDRRKSYRQRLEIRPPESLDIRHQLNLNVFSGNDMEINNNAAQLKFNVDQLKIRGPVSLLRWKGRAQTLEGKDNRVILPFQWLDISFQAKNLQLVFDDEDAWDPTIHLEAEAQVDGVQVFLLYDDKMSNLGEGQFKLSSSPSYTRKEILALLGSGEEPVQKTFLKSPTNETAQEAGPSFTLIKSRGRRNEHKSLLNYSAGVSSGEAPFEFRVDYRLGQHLGIEATQTTSNGVFMGLRYSKQVSKLSELLQQDDIVVKGDDLFETKVVWDFTGIPMGQSLGLSSSLKDALSKVEDSLKRGEYIGARQQISTILQDQLALEGYLSGHCNVKVIRKDTTLLERRNYARDRVQSKIFVQIEFNLGLQWSLSKVEINNWPKDIDLPAHTWFKNPHFRATVISRSEIQQFKNLLLITLADRGYPAAEIAEVLLEPVVLAAPEKVMDISPSWVSEIDPSTRFKATIPHKLVLTMLPGEIHRVIQLVVEGDMKAEGLNVEEVVGYTNNMIYSEDLINQFASKLKKWYEERGYFGTNIQVSQTLKSRRYPRISVHLKVEEGERWKLGKISFEGVGVSDIDYLRQVTRLQEDSPANPEELVQSISRLSRLPQLSSVNYRWKELQNGTKDLVIEVKESPAWRFATRVGIESDLGPQMALRARRGNLFGRGESISFENNFAVEERNHILRYEVPDIFDKEWRGQWLLGYQVELLSSREVENKTLVTGVSLFEELDKKSWGCDLIYREDKNIEGEFPSLRLKSVVRSSSTTLPKQPGHGWGWNLKNQLIDYLDSQSYAVVGEYILSYGVKFGESILTPWGRIGNYWPLGSSAEGLPFADRFFMGGTGSLRGFKKNSISGSKDRGGESLSSFGTELFYPITEWVGGTLFYEWGKIYDQSFLQDGDEPRKSIGMGAILRTPVGPIEGYFAHPLGEARLGVVGLQLGTIF